MRATPAVSVVVIFLDAERFLAEAIASVLAQDFGDWELLLVDDGSRDASPAIAREHARRDPRIRCLAHPGRANRGMSASRNLGIAHARAPLVAFLDGDDVWLPGKLARQVADLEALPEAALTFGAVRWWYSWTGEAADRARDYVWRFDHPDAVAEPPALLVRTISGDEFTPSMSSPLVRRAALEKFGAFEDAFTGLHEDQAFFSRLFLHVPVHVSGECQSLYRQHDGSCCAVAERSGALPGAERRFFDWLHGYFASQGVRDPRLLRPLARVRFAHRHPRLWRALRRARRLFPRVPAT